MVYSISHIIQFLSEIRELQLGVLIYTGAFSGRVRLFQETP